MFRPDARNVGSFHSACEGEYLREYPALKRTSARMSGPRLA